MKHFNHSKKHCMSCTLSLVLTFHKNSWYCLFLYINNAHYLDAAWKAC